MKKEKLKKSINNLKNLMNNLLDELKNLIYLLEECENDSTDIKKIEEKLTEIENKILDEDKIEKILERKLNEKFSQIEKNIENILNEKFKTIEENILKGNEEMLNKLIDKFKNLFNFTKENAQLKNTLDAFEKENAELKEECDKLKQEKEKLKKDIDDLQDNIKSKDEDIKSIKQKLSELEEKEDKYNELKNQIRKVSPLLNVILKNNSLTEFRKDFDINDNEDISLLNLYALVSNKENFINTIYKYIEEFKRKTPLALDEEEIEFYKKINEYFDEEIFTDIYSTLKENEFDKRKHRGINGEIRGELDDSKAVLIPYCKIGDKKMRVKLK